jgi:hypothetical protein
MSVEQTPESFCQQVKNDGSKCQAPRLAGSDFCFFHDPEKSAEREAAQRAGGQRNKMAVLPSTAPDARLQDTRDVVTLLSETINHVRRGEIDPKVANAVGYLGGLLMKAIHEAEIEKRKADEAKRAAEREREPTEAERIEMLRRLTPDELLTLERLQRKMLGLPVQEEAANGNGADNPLRPKPVPVEVPTPDAGTNGAGGGGSPGG